MQRAGGPDSAPPSTDLRELEPWALGLLPSSPAWPRAPAESPGEEALRFRFPRPRESGGLLPGCTLASSGPCLLQKLIQDTGPGWTGLFPVFPPMVMVPLHHHRAPGTTSLLGASLPPTPACFHLSQRSPSCTEGESTGPPCQLPTGALGSPESEDRRALEAVGGGALTPGLVVSDHGSWSWKGLNLGLAWPSPFWDVSPVTGPLTLACFVQHRLLGPVVRAGGLGGGPKSGELGDALPLCPFSRPQPKHLPRAGTVLPL